MAKSPKKSLPFEPRKKKKKQPEKQPPAKSQSASKTVTKAKSPQKKPNNRKNANLSAIPDAVSKRMTRRMIFFTGIPTVMGISAFFIFYWLFSQQVIELPPYLVLLVTSSLFGLGFVGLSYSVFSASWDEERDGGLVGFAEFKTNFGRMVSAWKNRGNENS